MTETIEVHNVWTLCMDDDTEESERPLAMLSRPQDWGHPRWVYNHNPICEFCQEPFGASREDARFCSSKCRTANHRREQRREEAQQGMARKFSKYTLNAYDALVNEMPNIADQVKDVYIEHGEGAATAVIGLSFNVMSHILARTQNQLKQKDERIERLREDRATLDHMAQLIRDRQRNK